MGNYREITENNNFNTVETVDTNGWQDEDFNMNFATVDGWQYYKKIIP